jgi:hypothetical protein
VQLRRESDDFRDGVRVFEPPSKHGAARFEGVLGEFRPVERFLA